MSSSLNYPMPNLTAYLEQWWGGSWTSYGWCNAFTIAANIFTGGNPAWGLNEFFSMYPKFGGTPVYFVGSTVLDSDVITLSKTAPPELTAGLYISDTEVIPPATRVVSVSGLSVTLDNSALGDMPNVNFLIYPNPVLPLPVLLAFASFSNACINYNRWLDCWYIGISLFMAHYCTLYLRSEGNPGSTAGQIAASGLEKGTLITKLAGDVSAGLQLPKGLEDWGAYAETSYGSQLATLGKIVGWGPMWIY